MNTGFYENSDTNFEQALILSETEFSHEKLIEMLKNGNIPQKQIAALKLDGIRNIEEGKILLSDLTGCDGKIREAVVFKLFELIKNNPETREIFHGGHSASVLADASIDINGNICRLAIDCADILSEDNTFSKIYSEKIINIINRAFGELEKITFKDKKYVINKQIFKIYWCLESLKNFITLIDKETLEDILTKSASRDEYTIREKTAQILVKISGFENLKNILKNDENYYVRNVFLNH